MKTNLEIMQLAILCGPTILGACSSSNTHTVASSAEDRCSAGFRVITSNNPYVNSYSKQAVLEMLKNNGCLGKPQPISINIDHTQKEKPICQMANDVLRNPNADAEAIELTRQVMAKEGC